MSIDVQEYKSWIEKFRKREDNREINYQNDVVKRLLENLFEDYDIVYADTKGPDSNDHDYYAYSGYYKYVNKNGEEMKKPTTPDLLICKNWNWFNKNNEAIQYIATIEVKSPFLKDAIWKKENENYPESVKTKVETHLKATKVKRVIYTDAFKWDFYIDTYNSCKTIELGKCVKNGRKYSFEWSDDQFESLKKKLEEFLKV